MSAETFNAPGFTRFKQLEYLIRTQQIDADFFWKNGAHFSSVIFTETPLKGAFFSTWKNIGTSAASSHARSAGTSLKLIVSIRTSPSVTLLLINRAVPSGECIFNVHRRVNLSLCAASAEPFMMLSSIFVPIRLLIDSICGLELTADNRRALFIPDLLPRLSNPHERH